MDELRIVLDLDVNGWPLGDRMDFEKVAGMTVQKAARLMSAAGADEDCSDEEKEAARLAYEELPSVAVAAFVWVSARRQRPGLTFDEAVKSFSMDDFLASIPEDDEPPLPAPNRAQRRSTSKSSARSRTTAATRRKPSSR